MGEWIILKRPKYSSNPTLHVEYGEWAEKRIDELAKEVRAWHRRHTAVLAENAALRENVERMEKALREIAEYEGYGCSSDTLSESIAEIKADARAALQEGE